MAPNGASREAVLEFRLQPAQPSRDRGRLARPAWRAYEPVTLFLQAGRLRSRERGVCVLRQLERWPWDEHAENICQGLK